MKIIITFGELLDRGLWLKYCELTGTNEWALSGGLADREDTTELTEDQAKELGL